MSTDDEVLFNKNDKLVPTKVLNVSNSIMEGNYISYGQVRGERHVYYPREMSEKNSPSSGKMNILTSPEGK